MVTRILSGLVLGLAAVVAVWKVCAAPVHGAGDVSVFSSTEARPLWRGVNSCSAASCHGGGHAGTRGSEQTTWASCDPHARAFAVLFEERSKVIVKNYYDLSEKRLAEPENATLCLSCHVAPDVARKPGVPPLFHADGVSCESCHGSADRWLTKHYQPSWKGLTPGEKAATGFRLTKDVLVRARLCADCHVGAPGMEVNHDLLAAGHPRLNFEFGSFQAIYPRHWSDREERARYPDFEARSWAWGQVVSAEAALRLLAYRAGNEERPWPEFAENNCYGCHQDLRPGQPRKLEPARKLGTLSLNEWYYAELPGILGVAERPAEALPELDALRRVLARRVPPRQEAADLARRAETRLAGWLGQAAHAPPLGPAQLRPWLLNRFAAAEKDPPGDWDQQTQDYLAAAALHHALKDLDPRFHDPTLLAGLCKRRKELEFPPGAGSPKQQRTP